MIDADKAKFEQWSERGVWELEGLRLSGNIKQGPVKITLPGGWIYERSYKNNVLHGFERDISSSSVWIRLYKEGKWVGGFEFSNDFVETKREDENNYFSTLTPSDFICPEEEDPCKPISLTALEGDSV